MNYSIIYFYETVSEVDLIPFTKKFNIVLTIVITIAPIKADKIPSIINPGTNQAAKPNINAFTTKANKPNVTRVIGNDINLTTGFMSALTIPTTTAAIIRAVRFEKLTPETIEATINNATALTTAVIKKDTNIIYRPVPRLIPRFLFANGPLPNVFLFDFAIFSS